MDSDKTAAQILSIMNKHKLAGEVTFMPLNKLLSKEQQHPTSPVSISFCTVTVECVVRVHKCIKLQEMSHRVHVLCDCQMLEKLPTATCMCCS